MRKLTHEEYENLLKDARPDLEIVDTYNGMRKCITVKDGLGILYRTWATNLISSKHCTASIAIDRNDWFIHKLNKGFMYEPEINFGGKNECFNSIQDVKSIINFKL